MPTRRAATSLDVRPDDYELEWMIDLRYVLVNVVDIYEIYKQAIEKNYELFEENIREYLGTQGINNGIIKTLKDSVDRANFFYYNNGITIICEKCETIKGTDVDKDGKNIYGFKLDNPQIVNGCQTVNSIAEVLSHCPQDKLFSEFSKAFVLVKVFVFDADTKQNILTLTLILSGTQIVKTLLVTKLSLQSTIIFSIFKASLKLEVFYYLLSQVIKINLKQNMIIQLKMQ